MSNILQKLRSSIGAKIILPYFILTLVVAAVGAFIITRVVVESLQERFENQLIDAGRVVSERIVTDESNRLQVLRVIANTEGVDGALMAGDRDQLNDLVPQIVANSAADAAALVNLQGLEVYGWQRVLGDPLGATSFDTDFSQVADVNLVLQGVVDEVGDKRVFLAQSPSGWVLYTAGPVSLDGEIVGAVLVGTAVRRMVTELTETAVARVTFYDQQGNVIDTTLKDEETTVNLQGSPEQYETAVQFLRESPEQYSVVIASSVEGNVLLSRVSAFSQDYLLAYGDWRLRNQSFGLFSVALPETFINRTTNINRTTLSVIFSIATIAVIVIGLLIARLITTPIQRLVTVSTAVAGGNLEQQTGIKRSDEIGILASSFDIMTLRLAERNRQLIEQASKLEAILHSIADGVIVFDNERQIISSNPAAERILGYLSENGHSPSTYLQSSNSQIASTVTTEKLLDLDEALSPSRFRLGGRVFSASVAPVQTPIGDELGRVVVLRDVTRQAEAEQLKDGFITSISHELRTPLTSMKGYLHLLLTRGTSNLTTQQVKFVEILQNSTEQLVSQVNKLIDITSIQEGSLKLDKQPVSLTALVTKLTSNWEDKMKSKDLNFVLQIPPNDLQVVADGERLSWALDNIVRNAHVYTHPGGQVEVCLSEAKGYAYMEVRDTGVGISAADLPHIFTRFYRSQNELTLKVPGLGIELFIAQSIVLAHNGRIEAKSELGKGSRFIIELPLSEKRFVV
jgi:PAS domain S-box-containing protein